MHRFVLAICISAGFLLMGGPPLSAADAPSQEQAVEQSVAPEAAAEADSGTCGGGGSCCGACQTRQKFAKNKDAAAGGCPCQRAKRAREEAARKAQEQ